MDEKLLEIIACPKCKGDLVWDREREILICETCRKYYPIREGIPVLLIEEAQDYKE